MGINIVTTETDCWDAFGLTTVYRERKENYVIAIAN